MYQSRRTEQPADVFIQPIDGDMKVWRYMDLAKLLYTLDRNVLVFPRVDLLKDPYEGVPTHFDRRQLVVAMRAGGVPLPLAVQYAGEGRANTYKALRRSVFVSCWHANEAESEAMWRLYCGESEGVALQTTYAALDASIAIDTLTYMGLVRYLDYDKESQPENALAPFMHKRRAFAHESEVRLLRWESGLLMKPEDDVPPPAIELPWDVSDVAPAVFVNPYAEEWYYKAVLAALDRFAPLLALHLKWSQIRRDPWALS